MGPFKQAQCEKDLEDACRAVGSAAGKVAVGEMPHDFLVTILDSQQQRIVDSFGNVRELKGERKALKLARDTASAWATAPLEVRNLSYRQAKAEIEDLIRNICTGTT